MNMPARPVVSQYCVVCGKTYGPHLTRCCTDSSLVSVKTTGLFRKRAIRCHPDGRKLTATELSALEQRETDRYKTKPPEVVSSKSVDVVEVVKAPAPLRIDSSVQDRTWQLEQAWGKLEANSKKLLSASFASALVFWFMALGWMQIPLMRNGLLLGCLADGGGILLFAFNTLRETSAIRQRYPDYTSDPRHYGKVAAAALIGLIVLLGYPLFWWSTLP